MIIGAASEMVTLSSLEMSMVFEGEGGQGAMALKSLGNWAAMGLHGCYFVCATPVRSTGLDDVQFGLESNIARYNKLYRF